MPRVKAPARRRPPVPALTDRPSRMRLLWRRQRRLIRPGIVLLGVMAAGIACVGLVHALGDGASFSERLGAATATLGLRVRQIVIEGRQKTPPALLNAAIGVSPGDPLLTISLPAARARIQQIPWVQEAEVERLLPDTLVVRLTERRPFAVWQHAGHFMLIDREGGTVTDSDVATFASQLPLVVGPGAPEAAATLLDALAAQPDIAARMTAAVRVGERRWNLRMRNGADILLPEGSEPIALARLAALQAGHAVLDRPVSVDLRLPDQVILRPLAGAAPDPATAAKEPPARRPT